MSKPNTVYSQMWCKYRCPLPFIYGLAYLGFQVALQSTGKTWSSSLSLQSLLLIYFCPGQPARYPFLDFHTNPEIAGVIMFISVLLLPSLHLLLCVLSSKVCQKCPPCHGGTTKND